MKLTEEIEQKIIDTINAEPMRNVKLPPHAYTESGRVIIRVDGLPVDLHRYLYEKLIRPLRPGERLVQMGRKGNINPYLFEPEFEKRASPTCRKGHPYDEGEPPRRSSGYRCPTCYAESGNTPKGRAKQTHCKWGHPLYGDNVSYDPRGRRRCLTCRRNQAAEYRARKREENK